MAEKEEKSGGIPWLPLITLIGVGSGVLYFLPQLTSSRPGGGEPQLAGSTFDEQTIDARLWQDPLGVSGADREKHEKQSEQEIQSYREVHSVGRFQKLLINKCFRESANIPLIQSAIYPLENELSFAKQAKQIQILAVMIPGGSYVEDAERRLRARRAVIEGLGIAGFNPEKDDEIGYFYVPWNPLESEVADCVRILEKNRVEDEDRRSVIDSGIQPARRTWKIPEAPGLLVPYEWCEQANFATDTKPVAHVLVLWLTDDAFRDAPLARLADLISWFRLKAFGAFHAADLLALPNVAVLGPDNSGTLYQMVREAQTDPWNDETRRCLATTHVYSSQAAAAESRLLWGVQSVEGSRTPFKLDCKNLIEKNVKRLQPDSGFSFDRTIFPDDQIVETLRRELGRRGVKDDDGIAILSEEDTYYSRALCSTFNAGSLGNIHSYTYLRGIDGKLPSDRKEERESKSEPESGDKNTQTSAQRTEPTERTEGRNQADDIRRLATMLQTLDADLRDGGSEGLKAVGLLGSDVYDKLELLKALRPMFPQAVFFTNNLDARLAHPDEWNETRNLVVVSARGLSLNDPDQIVQKVAPFRDSGQTALFEATLEVMGRIHAGDDYIPKSPLIFEIGRNGPVKLSLAEDESITMAEFFKLLKSYLPWFGGFIALGCLLVTWIRLVSRVTLGSSTPKSQAPDKNIKDRSGRTKCVEET
jgi:hypothetical protein